MFTVTAVQLVIRNQVRACPLLLSCSCLGGKYWIYPSLRLLRDYCSMSKVGHLGLILTKGHGLSLSNTFPSILAADFCTDRHGSK
ncbi:hypothetical protein SLA2020_018100 [Shorea laevis]